tara:strand:+ start:6589 stop:7446 length:858 start_codon:yes stop_codon:yes gene_type:complete
MRSLSQLKKHVRPIQDPDGGDGLIVYILDIIYENLEIEPIKWIVEFGAHPGDEGVFLDCLIKDGYKAVLIEGDKHNFEGLADQYKDNDRVLCINEFVGFEGQNSLDQILSKTPVPEIFDVLLIDVDSTDYQIWESLSKYNPLLAVIEFNETYGPHLERVHNIEFNQWAARNNKVNPGEIFGASSIAGSSLRSINELSKSKGYRLLIYTRNNAFFIKEELFHYFHLQEIDITKDFIQTTLNIPNKVLSIKDLLKKLFRFGFVKTFFRYKQQYRIRKIKDWRNKWKI